MKLSIYEFKDLTRSYGIIEFENDEYKKLISHVIKFKEKLKEILENKLGVFKCFKYAGGLMIYDEKQYPMTYISFETRENSIFTFEIYPNSMSAESNTNAKELLDVIYLVTEILIGETLRKPKGMMLGFTPS